MMRDDTPICRAVTYVAFFVGLWNLHLLLRDSTWQGSTEFHALLEATAQRAIPSMFHAAFWVEQGALASYGADYYAAGRQAARLVDKILKGTKPAEIPVEVNTKIEFVINLKVAQALGRTIAPAVLFRADRLIR